MATLKFVQRDALSAEDIAATPQLLWLFQGGNPGFLYSGSATVIDGYATDASGHVTTFAVVRPLAFNNPADSFRTSEVDPGYNGLVPLQFRNGRIGLRKPSYRVVMTTSAPSMQHVDGTITITSVSNLGSLTDFSIYGLTQEDPQAFYVETATDLDSGNVGSGYTRNSAVFVPHRNTRYLGVGAKIYAMPNSGNRAQLFKKWMVEKTEVTRSTPTTKYGKAREVVVTVRPDRINLAPNPSAVVDVSGWATTTNGVPSRDTVNFYSASTPASAQYTAASAGTMFMRYNATTIPVRVGASYSFSMYVQPRAIPRIIRAQMRWFDSAGATVSDSAYTDFAEVDTATWTLVKVENMVAPAGAVYGVPLLSVLNAAISEKHNVDNVLIERGEKVGTYFDGSTSVDTIWEGTVGSSRSYLYKNRTERYAAILRVLSNNVPLGIGVADPVFGTLPVDW